MASSLRILLLPYGNKEGKDIGLHEGFNYLLSKDLLSSVKYIYYCVLTKTKGADRTMSEIMTVAQNYQPHIIIWFHIGKFPVSHAFLKSLKNLKSQPTLVFHDLDAFGFFHKPVTKSMRLLMDEGHLICISGFNDYLKNITKHYPEKIIYAPHNFDKRRFLDNWIPTRERRYDVIIIGNRNFKRLKFLNKIPWMRMPGAYEREQLVRSMGKVFGSRFAVYGRGWNGFIGNQGPIPFDAQTSVIQDSWISLGYDHYPKSSYYHSDRLPIALISGVAHVAHYHVGYEQMYRNMEHIVWFDSVNNAVDTVQMMLSRGPDWLITLGQNGKKYALQWLSAERVWESIFSQIIKFRAVGLNNSN